MAMFSWSMQIIKRSLGRSVVAAAAYRAGVHLFDERQQMIHDYSRRDGVIHAEILAPEGAPAWCYDREQLWNRVEAKEKRKDAQLARELRFAIPREVPESDRLALVRDYVQRTFVDRGMIADFAIHNKTASDGNEQPHVHVLLTMRPLEGDDFGAKSRHEMVPCPEGRTHADGRPVMVESNRESWNSAVYFDHCRERWETHANRALEAAGSEARIDRRSLLERGLARLAEPAMRMAWYLKDLYGCMRERFGQFQVARHYRNVERAANEGMRKVLAGAVPMAEQTSTTRRYFDWFERQLARLQPASAAHAQAPPDDRSMGWER